MPMTIQTRQPITTDKPTILRYSLGREAGRDHLVANLHVKMGRTARDLYTLYPFNGTYILVCEKIEEP